MTEALVRLSTALTTGPPPETPALLTKGTITDITGATIRVLADGRDLSCQSLGGATGAIGEQVWLLSSGNSFFVVGSVTSGVGEKVGVAGYRTTDTALAANTMTPIALNALDTTDLHDFWDGATKFIVPAGLGGRYHISGRVYYSAGAGTMTGIGAFIRKNGTFMIARQWAQLGGYGGATSFEAAKDELMVPGDFVELCAYVQSATAATAASAVTPASNDARAPYLSMWAL